MEQTSSAPSVESCEQLLLEMPAMGAFRRALLREVPEHARTWIGPLAVVSRHPGGARVGQVAESLHVDISVASRHVTQLEERGLLARETDPLDGRALLLRTTPQGERWLSEVRNLCAKRIRTYLGGWSDDDVMQLTRLLDRFGKSIEHAVKTGDVAAREPVSVTPRTSAELARTGGQR